MGATMTGDGDSRDDQMQRLLATAMSDAHVAESARLVHAAMQIVPVPAVVQSETAGFSTSAN